MKGQRQYDNLLVHLSTGDYYLKEEELREGFIKIEDDFHSKENFNVVILFVKRVAGPDWLVENRYMNSND